MVMPHDHKMEGRGGSRSDLPRQEPLRACRKASLAYRSNRVSPWVRVWGWGGGILLSISVWCSESQQGVVPPGRRAGGAVSFTRLHSASQCQGLSLARPVFSAPITRWDGPGLLDICPPVPTWIPASLRSWGSWVDGLQLASSPVLSAR